MTTYTIVKSKVGRYHKSTIKCGFDIMEQYHETLLKYCAEMPYLPLTKEEVFSDLIIDRVPRFVVNFRKHKFSVVQDLLARDITAATNKKKYEHNKTILMERIREVKNSGVKNERNRLKIETLKKQVRYLGHLRKLAAVEKDLLAYLRSCVRRTKIKYLQQVRNTTENRLTTTADPTNGLLDIVDETTILADAATDPKRAEEILERLELCTHEKEVLMMALVYEETFLTIGHRLGCSRSTAARAYQNAFQSMMRQLKKLELSEEDF